jgi:hypothetical protein
MITNTLHWCRAVAVLLLGNTTFMFAQTYPAAEALPSVSELPDLLVCRDGTQVKNADDWFQRRRPELKDMIQHYMYGFPPAESVAVTAQVVRTDSAALNGRAVLREITLSLGPEGKGRIELLLITPAQSKGKVPVFVGLNFNGNHAVLPDPNIALPKSWMRENKPGVVNHRATDAGRGTEVDGWPAALLVERGYALATAYYGDIDPDKPDPSDGVQSLYYRAGQTAPADHEWGSVAAWAWGLSRMIDYLVTLDEIDATRVAAIGHSRLGKTALLAAALDERIAIACPHQSGTGGCAASRFNDQETIERIQRAFPHWFCGNFRQFAGREEKIPFDQHAVMALVAPRAIFDTEGLQDKWANFDNSLRSLRGAHPVYQLLGLRGLAAGGPLEQDTTFTAANLGELVQYRRDAKHALTSDYWKRILDYADHWYARAK